MFLWFVRDGGIDLYSERGLLLPISSSGSHGVPTLAPPCKLVRDIADRLRVPRSTPILSTLSKSDRVVLITWSPSGYTPVVPECPDRSVLFTNHNLTACQSTGITRNEPKIHGICYITAFFSERFVEFQVVQPYSNTDMATVWKNTVLFNQRDQISICLSYVHIDITFCRWDFATEECELLN